MLLRSGAAFGPPRFISPLNGKGWDSDPGRFPTMECRTRCSGTQAQGGTAWQRGNVAGAGADACISASTSGGREILSALVEENGAILARQRISTPRETGPEQAIVAVERLIEKLLKEQELAASDLTAIGVAVPGVVDPDVGRIVVTPNMHLTGVALGSYLQSRFHVPIALGNDCNLGCWVRVGSAPRARRGA